MTSTIEVLSLALSLAAGLVLGAIFFGGLWWTVRKGVTSPRPALWFIGSLLVRTSIILGGFYFIGRDHWERMLACLIGFLIARVIVTRLTKPSEKDSNPKPQEASDAP